MTEEQARTAREELAALLGFAREEAIRLAAGVPTPNTWPECEHPRAFLHALIGQLESARRRLAALPERGGPEERAAEERIAKAERIRRRDAEAAGRRAAAAGAA